MNNHTDDFLERGRRAGLPQMIQRFYSVYRALVVDNQDPNQQGSVRVVCPAVGHTVAPSVWALPAFAACGPGRGMFHPPEKGDNVWVVFKEGDPTQPEVYFGGYFVGGDLPFGLGYGSNGYPEKRGFVTRAGHCLLFNDQDGQEQLTILWHQPAVTDPAKQDRSQTADITQGKRTVLSVMPDASFSVLTDSGHSIVLDETNNQIQITRSAGPTSPSDVINMSPEAITLAQGSTGNYVSIKADAIDITANPANNVNVNVNAAACNINAGSVNLGTVAAVSAVLGEMLVTWLASHVHPVASVGSPTGPPVTAGALPTILSKSVKLQP